MYDKYQKIIREYIVLKLVYKQVLFIICFHKIKMYNKYQKIIQLLEEYIQINDEHYNLSIFINKEKDRFYEEIDKRFSIRGIEEFNKKLINKTNSKLDFEKYLDIYLIQFTKSLPYEYNYGLKYKQWKLLEEELDVLLKKIKEHVLFKEIESVFYTESLLMKDILEYFKYKSKNV